MKTGDCEVTTSNILPRNSPALLREIYVCDVTSAVLPNVGCCITLNLLRHYFSRDMPLYAVICRDMPLYVVICRDMPLYAVICRYMLLYAVICRYMPLYAVICRYMSLYAYDF
jgi:hypothetical protein